ncbi:N-acetylglucosamine-6-phosphate deacetylase [Blastopirellula sp. JC732]|uniref:N-acetylglucosamine-6-phosphate deacetylase n=1 Tax=Blastopirellula sediminis TaxID=2894196 RepID=A0A9X1MMD4_9BACT|nr:N-acetylglucosamine-6-phosphate deacetylase [Blastopirellula sediminis]MCC9608671.1 N-acetylglucosamine-6-phosphate deacetylase [Blastopirellula sediminis]MCC9628552.1 N-acetylglucosamine-6-phosphate deacetylase [Blastopirellula sediminis]
MPDSKFFDLQINGYFGVDFNQDDISADDLHNACAALERDNVGGVLATIITDDIARMAARLSRFVQLRIADPLISRMIAGFHIEGPFISTKVGYVGAHPVAHAKEATWDEMTLLLDAADGLARIVTLAPEQDPEHDVTRRLAKQGIVVSAGHTNASLDQLDASIDAGLSMFTHLGNGCPRLMDRHDNIIQRALSRADQLYFGFIADGAHVPFFALKNYLQITGLDRAFIVSDAISAAGCGPGLYPLGDRVVQVGEDGVPRAEDDSHLIGSGTTMRRMAENLERELGLTPVEIDRLTRMNPRRIMGAAIPAPTRYVAKNGVHPATAP